MSFQFPPPKRGSEEPGKSGFPVGERGQDFVFPPPRQWDPTTPYEVAEQVAGELNVIKDTARYAADEVANHGVVLEDYGNALERKVEPWAVPTVAPLSSTINRRADPTFQLSDFMVPNLPLAGTTVGASGHFHELTGDIGDPGRVERGLAEGWKTKNWAYVAFITPAINRAYEELNFMVGAVKDPCNFEVSIYVVDEDRMLHRQVGPIKVSETAGLGESLITVPFPRWVATQGSYVAISFVQTGNGNPRALLGLNDTPRPLSNVVFPRRIAARYTVPQIPRDTIDGTAHLDFETSSTWFVPYAELSESIGIDYRVFNEGWYWRGLIGRPWLGLTNPGVYSNGSAVSASGFGTRVSMYDTPLSTDHIRVRTSVRGVFSNGQRRTTIIIRGTRDLRSGVGLCVINASRYELISWRNQPTNRNWDLGNTVIETVGMMPNTMHNLEIDYKDGLVTFRVNGIAQFEDVFAGGPEGAEGRFLGLQMERTGNALFANPSPHLGPWSAQDIPQDEVDHDGDTGEGEGQ